jgi:hypothetical protein
MHRFEHLTGTEMEAREFFVLFKDNPQVLAVELRGPGGVKDRFDRLMDLLPELEPSAVRTAILEPPRLVP